MALSKKQKAEMDQGMREALVEISKDAEAFEAMNAQRRKAMIVRGLLTDEGAITHIGREFMANSDLDIHVYDAPPKQWEADADLRDKLRARCVPGPAVAASNGTHRHVAGNRAALVAMRSRLLGIIRDGSEGAVSALVDEVEVLNQLIEGGE